MADVGIRLDTIKDNLISVCRWILIEDKIYIHNLLKL